MTPDVFAHRGASAYAPENTLPAFELALCMGADGVELDVHMSADGELVIIHDESVDRTSNGRGEVRFMTLKEIKALDVSNGFIDYGGVQAPTLQEAYALLKPHAARINVELKCDKIYDPRICKTLLGLTKDMGMQDRVLYSSFRYEALLDLRALSETAQIALLVKRINRHTLASAASLRAAAIHPHYASLLRHPHFMEACRRRGFRVHPWTVDKREDMHKLCMLGVHAIITNKPDVARALLHDFSARRIY